MNETDSKAELPIHIVLGASDFTKVKTKTCPRVGNMGDPFAELTKFGWLIMSPGRENDLLSACCTRTWLSDYEKLCDLDVLGLKEDHLKHDDQVLEKFKKQLTRSEEGWYETGLIWKEPQPKLENNKPGSLARLRTLTKKLKNTPETFQSYDAVIKDQLENDIIEKVNETESVKQNEFYLPHRAVIRKNAESTKLRVVYDASAQSASGFSLNECLEKGPCLQNKLSV